MKVPSDPYGENMAKGSKKASEVNEPSMIVKPISRMGGLDNIHAALIVVIAILIAIVLVISYSKPVLVKTSQLNCTYGSLNGGCVTPIHNASQVRSIVENKLADYAYLNTSLYVLAYLSNVSAMSLSYVPSSSQWLATLPVKNPVANGTLMVSMLINDATGQVTSVYIQSFTPPNVTNNIVVAPGVIKLVKQSACTSGPAKVQWFLDPYAPGAVQSLLNATALQSKFGAKMNLSMNILSSQYTQSVASTYGSNNADALGQYIFCASGQKQKFPLFVANLNIAYDNAYLSPNTLASVAATSGLNTTALSACISSSSSAINAQALLAQFYGIVISPSVVTDCAYMSLPSTANSAICYGNSTMC